VPTLLYFDGDEETRVDGLGLPAPLVSKSALRASSTTVCLCVCVRVFTFLKVLSMVTLHSKCTRALTFERSSARAVTYWETVCGVCVV
jgi:hypothetical protein